MPKTKKKKSPKPKSMWDLAGSGSKYATVEEMNKLLDTLREEDR